MKIVRSEKRVPFEDVLVGNAFECNSGVEWIKASYDGKVYGLELETGRLLIIGSTTVVILRPDLYIKSSRS